MGTKEEIEALLRDKPVTKIHGQVNDQNLSFLRKELAAIASGIPTSYGGGRHGHIGLLLPQPEYVQISHGGAPFDTPPHPGAYPAQVSADPATRAHEEALHREAIREYDVCAGVRKIFYKIMNRRDH